jgi:type VI secretion system secreted protein VgrG
MGYPSQANHPMEVFTPLDQDVLILIGFSGQEFISQPFSFQLDLISDNRRVPTDIPFEGLLGKKIGVRMNLPGGNKRFFHGLCYRVSQTGKDSSFTYYRMELVPQFWLLSRRAQSRIFQRQSVKDILEKVLRDLGLRQGQDLKFEIEEDKTNPTLNHPRDYCTQYRETDFNFACRLMEEEGIFYFFRHSQKAHQMVLANTPASHPEVFDKPELATIEYENVVGGPRENRIYNWTKVQTVRSGAYRLRDQCFEKVSANKPPIFDPLETTRKIQEVVMVGQVPHMLKLSLDPSLSVPFDALELYDYPGEYAQRFDAVNRGGGDQADDMTQLEKDKDRAVGIRMQEEAVPALLIQGVSNCRQLSTGHQFTLSKHFNANGPYVVTGVIHAASDPSYRSGTQAPFTYTNNFTCQPLALPFRPPRTTFKPTVPGTQTAVVVGLGSAQEEYQVDRYGRVKVQFHWDRPGPHNSDPDQGKFKASSCWVRVAQAWAGKRWGTFFWPRIGQEVIVAFLEGDPDQPIIVGSVYNEDQKPPYLGNKGAPGREPENPKLSGIKTNTTLGGEGFNELRFDDTKDKQQVFIHAEKDMDQRVKNDSREAVVHDRHLVVGAEKDGKKQGDQRELVYQDKHLNVKRNHVEHVEGNMQLLVGGGDGDNGNQDIVIKKDKKELIENDNHLHVKANRNENIDGAQSLTVGADQHEKVGQNHALEAGMQIHIKAGMTLVLEAGMQLSLKVGGNFIDINPAGVSIQGTIVMINSGGAAGSGSGAHPQAAQDANEASPTKPDTAEDANTGVKSAP